MPKPKVYLETTILGYLTPMRIAAPSLEQQLRRQHAEEFWQVKDKRFELFVSELVHTEASRGRPDLVEKRTGFLIGLPLLAETEEVTEMARHLLEIGILPPTAAADALHIAFATCHCMDFLATYNFKHIDNVGIERQLERAAAKYNRSLPVLCSPGDLLKLPA